MKKNTIKLITVFLGVLFLTPLFANAQLVFADIVNIILGNIIDPLVVLLVALALVFFMWGVAKYILHAGDENKRAEGIKMMTYGIIGLFVIVSVWGLIRILQDTFFGPFGAPGAFF